MYKKNSQNTASTRECDQRRNSCPSPKDTTKKQDFLMVYKNGSAQILRSDLEEKRIDYEATLEAENAGLCNELENAHISLPKPEAQPTRYDTEERTNDSDEQHETKPVQLDEGEGSNKCAAPMLNEEENSTTKPQSGYSKSMGRDSKVFTESDEEKEEEREKDKNSTLRRSTQFDPEKFTPDVKFSEQQRPSFGRTLNLYNENMAGQELNTSHSSRSTVVIAESPHNKNSKTEEIKQQQQETEECPDTKEPEMKENPDTKPPKSMTREASKVIENVVAHDGPLIQPKAQEVSHANILSMKNKLNLEIYLKVENLLYAIKESIMSGRPIFQYCRDYIEIAPKIDRESFEKIFKEEAERKHIKSSFILKRLGVILMLYFTVENNPNEKAIFQLKNLINIIHQNFLIFGYLISQKLKDKNKSNVWIARLMELLEHDSSANFTKSENLDKMAYNNTNLCNIMKGLYKVSIEITSMRNKEIIYAFNSIVVQLDKIPIKEAYTRLLKSFSVFMSEKELKAQVNQYMPKKPAPVESKIQQLLKREEKKEELAFLPKLIKGGIEQEYTLVVDLDETLVHYAELPGKLNELRVRPYVAHFLSEVSKYYEIVVFTAAMQEYADWVLDNIDKEHCVTHRLYRQHASPDGYNFDLSKLGRDMARIMIVDNLAENFKLQPDNGIYIKPWYDDPEDTALLELTPLLIEIARKKVPDVRIALRRFRDQMLSNIEHGCENPHLNLKLD